VVVQRVSRASVSVDSAVRGSIDRGLLIFLGVGQGDNEEDLQWLLNKVASLRVFEDENGRMQRSLEDIDGEALVISQFTLFGNVKKGSRPSFNRAADPEVGLVLYEAFAQKLSKRLGKPVPTGVFGALMHIEAHNDGPVTLLIDSKQRDF